MWFYLALTTAALWAIASLIDEHIVDKYIDNPLLNALIYSIIGLIAGIIIFVYFGPYPLSAANMFLCLLAGAAYTITISMYFLALKKEEVTRVAPLMSLAAIFTIILAKLFLNESFAPITYLAIALIVTGAILISIKITKQNNGYSIFRISAAVILMLIGGLFSGISAVIEKYLMIIGIPSLIVFGYSRIGVAIPAILLVFIVTKEIRRLLRENKKHIVGYMFCSETITIVGTLCIFGAMALGPVTLVSSIVTSEPIFVLAFATIVGLFVPGILKQELGRNVLIQKVIATLIIILGIILII